MRREVTGFGEKRTLSITSRSGSDTCATEMTVDPCVAFAGATSAVCDDVAVLEPRAFVAVTCARIVCPTSADASVYFDELLLEIVAQFPPWASQRCHA